jgi:hypothetical protein
MLYLLNRQATQCSYKNCTYELNLRPMPSWLKR